MESESVAMRKDKSELHSTTAALQCNHRQFWQVTRGKTASATLGMPPIIVPVPTHYSYALR